jgi:hypothetical protein
LENTYTIWQPWASALSQLVKRRAVKMGSRSVKQKMLRNCDGDRHRACLDDKPPFSRSIWWFNNQCGQMVLRKKSIKICPKPIFAKMNK